MSSVDETMTLIDRAHKGDKGARDQLVLENMGLIWSIVRRFQGRGHEMEDLFQIGSIGLMKAIDKFDLSYDVRFSTYAVPMIMGEIKRFLRDDGMIKVSRSLKEMGMKARTVSEALTNLLGREPTVEEIAREIGASKEEVAASMEAGAEVESLYKTIQKEDDSGLCLMDKIEDENQDQERLLNHMVLSELIHELGEKEQEIILRRYYENQTQTEIARALNISQVQVSRLEKKILKQMRDKF
ncbi:MAG: RNA polymerase sporulation sigma factor SigF [Hungatella sp.]|nr:RNA polymerase sporulation sigma factor SigF [Hungatella sp.]